MGLLKTPAQREKVENIKARLAGYLAVFDKVADFRMKLGMEREEGVEATASELETIFEEMPEIAAREERLRDRDAVLLEELVPERHEAGLTDRRQRLPRFDVARHQRAGLTVRRQAVTPGGDRARGDHDDLGSP